MPDIEELYNEYNLNKDEVVFLGIVNPASAKYPNNQDVGKEDVISFLKDKKYTFPTLFDESGEVLQNYNISAFPTTFMIDKEGNIYIAEGQIFVFDKSGKELRRINLEERPLSMTFGGTGGNTLFVTTETSLYGVRIR